MALSDLEPKGLARVIDLVRESGVDVSDWANSKRGERGAAMNPKYCYEWAFEEPGTVVVLNLWHGEMDEREGMVVHDGNFRNDPGAQGNSTWARRRKILERAVHTAWRDNLPIRVIINHGNRRDKNDPSAKASSVKTRALDPTPWSVATYDVHSGDHLLVRRRPSPRFVDQYSILDIGTDSPRRRPTATSVYDRDRAVREAALRRSGGRCEHCDSPGFRRPDGSIYLETHHIVALHKGGVDRVENVIALCPNDHRIAHYGEEAAQLRTAFLLRVTSTRPDDLTVI